MTDESDAGVEGLIARIRRDIWTDDRLDEEIIEALTTAQHTIEELREWNRQMVEKAASGGVLDGYRALGQKCARLEAEADQLRRERDEAREEAQAWKERFETAQRIKGTYIREAERLRAQVADLTRERDEAEQLLESLQNRYEQVTGEVADLTERLEKAGEDGDRLRQALAAKTEMYSSATLDVYAERVRQVHREGWTLDHDDSHRDGELARAAACYAYPHHVVRDWTLPIGWPWDASWWKPKDRRRDLVRAAALLVAEIERLDRAALRGEGE